MMDTFQAPGFRFLLATLCLVVLLQGIKNFPYCPLYQKRFMDFRSGPICGFSSGEILDYKDKQCIINKTLEATSPDNYHDCNTPEALENNSTRCCKQEGNTSCCGPNRMLGIGLGIATSASALMLVCVLVFWCNTEAIPALARCPCKCFKKNNEEKLELSDIISNSKSSYGGRGRGDEYAPPNMAPEMPEELRADPDDGWWARPQTRLSML